VKLIHQVFGLCKDKLVGKGWDKLLKVGHGLEIEQPNAAALAEELQRTLLHIDRRVPGFEDFAHSGKCGVEPGSPARSLLFHALASPNVLNDLDGRRLGYFPTLAEIEAVENYVFGAQPPSLQELSQRVGGVKLAVVVFAYEYRPAGQTSHGRHADMAYARTGVSRVGTALPNYHPEMRGFRPEADDPFDISVSPARFAAYLAVERYGDSASFLPMRYRSKKRPDDPDDWEPDGCRKFSVPIHKLFSGKECIRDLNLEVNLSATHVNEKIYRVHKALRQQPRTTPPYRFKLGIASLSTTPEFGTGTLIPEPHPGLVEPAATGGRKPVSFRVPRGTTTFSSFDLSSVKHTDGSGPDYIHIRTEIRNGETTNLNELTENALMKKVFAGGYRALHYVDFTADGWIAVDCSQLKDAPGVARKAVPAYSLVTAPDFFPSCDQRELTEWTASLTEPAGLEKQIWNITPDSLCDVRLPANLQLPKSPFAADDKTMTAIVGLDGPAPEGKQLTNLDAQRHSHLPDDAAGIFAPGWDVGVDTLKAGRTKTDHLAAYRLGSPFPEDAKLCAALSTFWPAVAPDATREMEPSKGNESGTVSPLTDEEIGQIGNLPWDGVPGPQVVLQNGEEFAEFASFQHVDYVQNALSGKFTLRQTARVDAPEYERRVLALALCYLALGMERDPKRTTPVMIRTFRGDRVVRRESEACFWKLLSFQVSSPPSAELEQAQNEAKANLPGPVIYRLELFPVAVDAKGNPSHGPVLKAPNFQKKRIRITERYVVFVNPKSRLVLIRKGPNRWTTGRLGP
jgi:hypothetical protein